MAYEDNRLAHGLKFFKLVIALCLEKDIAHGERLIDNQDFRIDVDGDRKSQPHEHTAGICLDRLVHIGTDVREREDVVHFRFDFRLGKANHRAV